MLFSFQNQEFVYLIYTGFALGILLVFSSVVQLLSRRENRSEAKSRRMRMLTQGKSTAERIALLKPPEKGGILTRLPFVGNLPVLLTQSGLTIRPRTFLALCLSLTMLMIVIGMNFFSTLEAVAIGIVAGFIIPIVVIKHRRAQKIDSLVRQLPDALDLMSRGLRVGHPLSTSIGAVAREMPDPIGTEFGIVFDQVNFGDDLTDAFQEFADRVDIEDVSYLSASIGIQHGTGGDLARVIQILSNVIRNRISMRRKIQAISSEGRLSAWFLSALPLVIFGFTSMSSPDYYGGVAEDPLFRPMVAAIVFFTVLNLLVLRKLVNFRI